MLNSLFSDAGRLWLIAGCAALCLCICLPMFLHYKKIRLELAACFKSIGTACAMIMALIASIKLDPRCWVCFAGLAVHSVADALLEYHFLIGMGTFICGHILYIAFFTGLFSFSAPVLICFLILAVLLVLLLYRFRKNAGKSLLPCAVYASVLCAMAACGIGGGISSHTVQGAMIALGAFLFVISDSLIFRSLLFPAEGRMNKLIMITYYCSQLLIGASCLFI